MKFTRTNPKPSDRSIFRKMFDTIAYYMFTMISNQESNEIANSNQANANESGGRKNDESLLECYNGELKFMLPSGLIIGIQR